jgi:hypothetical protein
MLDSDGREVALEQRRFETFGTDEVVVDGKQFFLKHFSPLVNDLLQVGEAASGGIATEQQMHYCHEVRFSATKRPVYESTFGCATFQGALDEPQRFID